MKRVLKLFLNDDGYTFIETFVLLIFLGILSTVIYTNSSSISKFSLKAITELEEQNDLLKLKVILREEAGKVRYPWFLKEYKIIAKDNIVTLPYYLGDYNKELKIEYGVSGLTIVANNQIQFNSTHLTKEVNFSKGYIYYDKDIFPLGVILE